MLKETIDAININFKRALSDCNEIKSWGGLMPVFFNDDNKRRVIDSFIFRFIKIQDLMGEKLFKELLTVLREYKRNMSFIDVLDRMERLEIIDNADKWNDYRELRNGLSHEYPANEDEIIKEINLAIIACEDINNLYLKIIEYLKNKNI